MRTKIILTLSFLIPFALLFTYIWATATNYTYSDEIYAVRGGVVENYLNGTLSFADLWRPALSIRVLGYRLLLLADIKWFSMNSRIFVLIIPFLLLSSAFLIYTDYRKSLSPGCSPEFIATTLFFLTLIIFNIIQWQALIFRGALFFQLPMPFIIASFISLELYLSQGRKYWIPAFILTALAVLIFGGTIIFSFAPALSLTFLCYILTRRLSLKIDFWLRASTISFFLVTLAFIYIFKIYQNDYIQPFPYSFVTDIFSRPLEAMQFYLSAFGASIIGIDVFFTYDYFSLRDIILTGVVVLLFYVFALTLFFKSRMYEKTYLPFFLITQVFFFLAFMTIARFGLNDISYSMSSRYTCVSLFGLASIVWILIFFLSQPAKPNVLMKSIINSLFVIIFSGLLLTSIVVWRVQPERKAKFEQLYDIAMRVDTATYDELLNFAAPPELVRDSLRLLRKHKLNMYHSAPEDRK